MLQAAYLVDDSGGRIRGTRVISNYEQLKASKWSGCSHASLYAHCLLGLAQLKWREGCVIRDILDQMQVAYALVLRSL
jgi:hypothetical protein